MVPMMPRPRVVMLAKPPLPGRVKTRLSRAGGLSLAAAAEFSAACLADLAARLAGCREFELLVCGPAGMAEAERAALARLLPAAVPLLEEPVSGREPRDFGQVMEDVVFAQLGDGVPAMVVGSDCALLPATRVREAVAALREAELVLGPDQGGGCYLIGLARPLPLLTGPPEFGPVVWSQGTDFEELCRRATHLKVRVAVLETERDIDGPADLAWLRDSLATGDAAATAPRLAGWFERRER